MEKISINNTGWKNKQAEASDTLMLQNGGRMTQTEAIESLRDSDEKQTQAKDKLALEIFNHYFLNFSGNG